MANEENLVHFKKGGDPRQGHRPKGVPNTKTRLQRFLKIIQDVDNPITGQVEALTVAEQMDMAMILKGLKGDKEAYNALIDRLEGKAVQSVDMNVSDKMKDTQEKIKDFLNDTDDTGSKPTPPNILESGDEVAQATTDIPE